MKGYPGLTELLTEHDKMIKHRLSNKKQKYFSIEKWPNYLLNYEKKKHQFFCSFFAHFQHIFGHKTILNCGHKN